jgi:hypothetical protein
MILPFLTAPERQGYQPVPATLSETGLRQHFDLTGAARFEYINRLGKYTFAQQKTLLHNGLRPLRQPGLAVALAAPTP